MIRRSGLRRKGDRDVKRSDSRNFPGTSSCTADSLIITGDYFDLDHARQKAYRLLARRPQSARELERKLLGKGFPVAIVKEALEKLHELKYLDDASFASQWARHLAVNKFWGNRKIIGDLQAKGVESGLIDEAVAAAREEMPEEAAVDALMRKKTAGKQSIRQDIKEKKKIFQSLLSRGFPPALILNKLGKIPEEEVHVEDGQ